MNNLTKKCIVRTWLSHGFGEVSGRKEEEDEKMTRGGWGGGADRQQRECTERPDSLREPLDRSTVDCKDHVGEEKAAAEAVTRRW
jgi:hypothetical protein